MATDAELLANIDIAIADIVNNGQQVTIDGDVYDKANLSTLFKEREKYAGRVNTSTDTFFSRMKTGIPRRS